VLFSSLVDDPSEYMPDEESARIERERLFDIIEDLVIWENSNNEEVLDKAKMEIARSVARNLNLDVPIGKEAVREFLATKAPPVLDPFAGGGSIPLEAQRLGLRAYASDLNPVAVLINKALIEIPPKFANMPPVHPVNSNPPAVSNEKRSRKKKVVPQDELWQKEWKGAQGLAEDVRYYGQWMRDEAFKRIGHLYPPVTITKEILTERSDLKSQGLKPGDELTVIAWQWARTVACPNPACKKTIPLIKSFWLSTKKDKKAWIQPIMVPTSKDVTFSVQVGNGKVLDGTVNRNGATCIHCKTSVPFDYISQEGKSKRLGSQMTAIIAESSKGRIYLPPTNDFEKFIIPSFDDIPETHLPNQALGFRVQRYGITDHIDLFTPRQLAAIATFGNLLDDVRQCVLNDSMSVNLDYSSLGKLYSDAISVYLSFAIDKGANYWSSLCAWHTSAEKMVSTFSRQTMSMVWDFTEANPFSSSSGNVNLGIEQAAEMLDNVPSSGFAWVEQHDATEPVNYVRNVLVSTDPPYYDNINYSDLSDFFYIWLRRNLSKVYPELFATLLTPKSLELIAEPGRFNGEKRLSRTFTSLTTYISSDYPISIFYAFKQQETDSVVEDEDYPSGDSNAIASTGWEKMLEALMRSGFSIIGTWPMRTEQGGGLRLVGRNSLASSIVLVCRPRPENAPSSSRREFLSALKKEIAPALRELQQGSIAPVDLAQAAIGPGMAIYSRYSGVLEADGKPMSVRTALTLINQALDEFLAEQEGEYDGDTRWALTWFEQYGHNEAAYGVAETLSRAKNTSVDGLSEAGIVEARGGKVRLYRREELDTDWDPIQDKRLTAWESTAHLIYALENSGEEAAAELLANLGPVAEVARDLAYRLYTVCERKGWAQDALGYNMLVVAWPRLKELAVKQTKQDKLL
jgi:putative DNA methylase